MELSEDGIAILNEKLRTLEPGEQVTVVYFQPDSRKAGGAYIRYSGTVKRADAHRGALIMADETVIGFSAITEIIK